LLTAAAAAIAELGRRDASASASNSPPSDRAAAAIVQLPRRMAVNYDPGAAVR